MKPPVRRLRPAFSFRSWVRVFGRTSPFWVLAVSGCGHGGFPTVLELPKGERAPEGILLDPTPALPSAQPRAMARGIIVLREGNESQALHQVVVAYAKGFQQEDPEALAALLTPDAVRLGSQGQGGRVAILEAWRQRLRSLDYSKVVPTDVFRLDRMEVQPFTADSPADDGERPAEMRPGDRWLRVPVARSRWGGERLFPDVVTFVVRWEDGRFRIAGIDDDVD